MKRKTITVFIGSEKHMDLIEFFSKYPENQWNSIARDMLKVLVAKYGPQWNPLLDGYNFTEKVNPLNNSNVHDKHESHMEMSTKEDSSHQQYSYSNTLVREKSLSIRNCNTVKSKDEDVIQKPVAVATKVRYKNGAKKS